MSEVFRLSGMTGSSVEDQLLIRALVVHCHGRDPAREFKAADGVVEVAITVNGIPISPRAFLEGLAKAYPAAVKQEAAKMVKERLTALERRMQQVSAAAAKEAKAIFPELDLEDYP